MDVTLRKVASEFAGLLATWRNQDREFFGDSAPIDPDAHLRFLDELDRTPNDLLYIVCVDGHSIGTIGITISEGEGEVQRILLGEKAYARSGAMSQALALLLDAFGLRRYWLRVKSDNETAIGFYRRNGFWMSGEADGWLVMERYL